MLKWLVLVMFIHFGEVLFYLAWVDKYYCQRDDRGFVERQCYDWKGAAGVWEAVLIIEGIKKVLP